MNKKNHIIISAIVLLVVAGGTFYGGMLFGQGRNRGQGSFQANGGVSIRGNNRQGGMIAGEIISKDDKSITIKLINGGSKIIFYSGATEIGKFTSGTADDLALGKSVSVAGSSNSDGSVTAQSIQIRPVQQTNNPAPAQ